MIKLCYEKYLINFVITWHPKLKFSVYNFEIVFNHVHEDQFVFQDVLDVPIIENRKLTTYL